MKQTQAEMILRYLEENGSISQKEAAAIFGCYRLSARIFDLRALGFDIRKEMATEKNRFGVNTSFARYWLKEEKKDGKQAWIDSVSP